MCTTQGWTVVGQQAALTGQRDPVHTSTGNELLGPLPHRARPAPRAPAPHAAGPPRPATILCHRCSLLAASPQPATVKVSQSPSLPRQGTALLLHHPPV